MSLHVLQLITVRWHNACADYALRLSRGLAARGHRVVVAGFSGSPPVELARAAGLPVLDAFDFRARGPDVLSTSWRFRRYLRESRFDVINAHRGEDHFHAALALAPRRPIPLVRTRGDVRFPRGNWFNRRLYEKHTDAHVVAADFMRRDFYDRFTLGPDRLVTIRPGIDAEAFRSGAPEKVEARRRLDFPVNARVVGLIGRYTAAKGQLAALEAFSRVRRRFPSVHFLISGTPNDIPEGLLRERAHHLGLDANVHFHPPAADVRQLMAALDAGVVASQASEAICRVALEYMALGIPVVGTRLNSIPEMVLHGATGLIVPPGDPPAMAGAIERLLEEPELRERLGEEGARRVARDYDLSRLIDATETLYRRLIRERKP